VPSEGDSAPEPTASPPGPEGRRGVGASGVTAMACFTLFFVGFGFGFGGLAVLVGPPVPVPVVAVGRGAVAALVLASPALGVAVLELADVLGVALADEVALGRGVAVG